MVVVAEERAVDVAARYGVTGRTVERWRAMGRKSGRRPPTEDPSAMAQWWARVSNRPVPAVILEACGKHVASGEAGAVAEGTALDLDQVAAADDLGVEVLAREVAACAIELRAARMAGDRGQIAAAQRQIREMTAALRQLERTREELARKSGRVIGRDEVAAWVKRRETKLAQAFAVALARAVERARSEGLLEARMIVEEERDRCFRALKDERDLAG